jgi:anthranilate phosphoribosyltransferase
VSALADALACLASRQELDAEAIAAVLAEVLSGEAPEPLVAAFLTAWHLKGETSGELAAVVRAVRERMVLFELDDGPATLLDTCGTGGDGASTLNVSTATALVGSCLGVAVAKHGNRSASGTSGSAEVLAELGVAIAPDIEALRRCLRELSLAFLFAPKFHPTLGRLATVRKMLPFRTVFNLVGPLANPARPSFQLIGVPGKPQAELMARTLAELGTTKAAVVTGAGGLDEVSLAGPTQVIWVEEGDTFREVWTPHDFGLPEVEIGALRVSGPADSADRLLRLLAGERGPGRDVVVANVAAALSVAGRFQDLSEGARQAEAAIDSGAAAVKLARWVEISQGRA